MQARTTTEGCFGWNRCHCLTIKRVHASGVHIIKQMWHLFDFVKGVWVRMGLHRFTHNSLASGDEATANIKGKGVVVYLAQQSDGCGVCTTAQSYSTHSSCIPTHINDQQDSNIAFEIMFVSWLPIACPNYGPAKSGEGWLARRKTL